MKLSDHPSRHLCYCLNVHPGETWQEHLDAIRTSTLAIRDRAGVSGPFGLGLRISREAANALADQSVLAEFVSFMGEHDLYAFTVNGFPYGQFHGAAVKEDVYRPDWTDSRRVAYTVSLARILSDILPAGVRGSISTVPGAYRAHMRSEVMRDAIVRNLADTALRLNRLWHETGREIHVGLEPEPDCMIETTPETIAFFRDVLFPQGCRMLRDWTGMQDERAEEVLRRHIGVCFDTCHLALQFEDLPASVRSLHDAGIRISKMQISSALHTDDPRGVAGRLSAFDDGVYLHQVKIRTAAGVMVSHQDLPAALADPVSEHWDHAAWRIHCHVPLHYEGADGLYATGGELTSELMEQASACGVEHFEIETYTFNVLPAELREQGIVDSVVREYDWVMPLLMER